MLTDWMSVEMPPWMHRNLLLMMAERGRLSKRSMTMSYTYWSYLDKPR